MENPKEESHQGKIVYASDQGAANTPESGSRKDAKSTSAETVKSERVTAENEVHVVQNTARLSPDGAGESRFAGDRGVSAVGSSNPYVAPMPAESSQFSLKDAVFTAKDVLGRWAKNVGEASRKAEILAGNTWQHSIGRIAQGTKVIAEGGYQKIFRHTFETEPNEKLVGPFVCYLSTSAGPVMGVLYVSTEKLAFCSDSPIPYKTDGQTEYSYYKVVIPLNQVKAVNPSSSNTISGLEKYIQVVSVDNHEFWYMGFLYYDEAVKCLQDSVEIRHLESV